MAFSAAIPKNRSANRENNPARANSVYTGHQTAFHQVLLNNMSRHDVVLVDIKFREVLAVTFLSLVWRLTDVAGQSHQTVGHACQVEGEGENPISTW